MTWNYLSPRIKGLFRQSADLPGAPPSRCRRQMLLFCSGPHLSALSMFCFQYTLCVFRTKTTKCPCVECAPLFNAFLNLCSGDWRSPAGCPVSFTSAVLFKKKKKRSWRWRVGVAPGRDGSPLGRKLNQALKCKYTIKQYEAPALLIDARPECSMRPLILTDGSPQPRRGRQPARRWRPS